MPPDEEVEQAFEKLKRSIELLDRALKEEIESNGHGGDDERTEAIRIDRSDNR